MRRREFLGFSLWLMESRGQLIGEPPDNSGSRSCGSATRRRAYQLPRRHMDQGQEAAGADRLRHQGWVTLLRDIGATLSAFNALSSFRGRRHRHANSPPCGKRAVLVRYLQRCAVISRVIRPSIQTASFAEAQRYVNGGFEFAGGRGPGPLLGCAADFSVASSLSATRAA
jgi:hypothetical protein